MDRAAYFAADVGFGTWVWRGGELNPHPPGGRTRGRGHQPSSGTPHGLAQSKPFRVHQLDEMQTHVAGKRSTRRT